MGRVKNIDKELTASVQGVYKNYCMYVHTPEFFTVPGFKEEDIRWKPSRFHKFLCDTVQDFVETVTNNAYDILILSCPPQFGKSETITKTFPSWFLLRNPDKFVIEISYGNDLAERFGKANLEKVKEHGRLFGVEVDPKKATSQEFYIKGRSGGMISRGRGSSLTGYSGHLILIDDPIKNREEADSETKRESLWNEFVDSMTSRAQAGTKIVLIMTRWHEDDLAGRIIANYPKDVVTVVNIPCEAEENDVLGRKPGQALCPEIGKGDAWLKQFKRTMTTEQGIRSWNALYQGHPSAREGNILKREWWQFYERKDYDEGRLEFDQMILSVDATFKDGEKNDFVAIGVLGKRKNRIYLVELINKHLNFTGTIEKIRQMMLLYPDITQVLIEDKANGSAIIEILRSEIMGVIPVNPDSSKEARVNAVSFAIEAGNVFLPRDKNFTWELIDQCSSFPNGRHDDMVDMLTQGLSRLIFTRTMRRNIRKNQLAQHGFHLPKRKSHKDYGGEIKVM